MDILWYVISLIVLDVILSGLAYYVFGDRLERREGWLTRTLWQRRRARRRAEQSKNETLGAKPK